MKTTITLKSFGALPPEAARGAGAFAPAGPEAAVPSASEWVQDFQASPEESAERFREDLHRRSVTPFRCDPLARHWGINE